MDDVKRLVKHASDSQLSKAASSLLFLVDAVLSILVVWKIPYTEIDWKAYMQQVAQYVAGERDYVKIYGDTGPLVYPAGHVSIYRLLYAITDEGRDIKLAQYIFIGLYLASLMLVMQCYRQAKVPPYIFPLLILSKRLHSIFLLRLFNDGFAVFFLFLAIYCYQRRLWTIGSLAYSYGLAVKMTLLLALPAVAIVLWQGVGRNRALQQAMIMAQLQLLVGYPFIAVKPRSYLTRAFELTREFKFEWTVNWRFIGEEGFLSKQFARALLGAHVTFLLILILSSWLHVSPQTAVQHLIWPPSEEEQGKISRRVTPRFILTTILSSMIVGCLCARSLHYQFYVYIAWSTPFLLWTSSVPPALIFLIWIAQEYVWNVYPSTGISSIVVVGCLQTTFLAILGADEDQTSAGPDQDKKHRAE